VLPTAAATSSTASPARLARLLHGLWKVPAYEPIVQQPLVERDVAAVEAHLGVRLPETYLAALREQNGGYVRRRYPELVQTRLWGIGPVAPNLGSGAWLEACESAEIDGAWLPRTPELLVPFDGDGHWYVCLDYRKAGARAEPSVTLVDLELERERRLAPSFDAFLARCDVDAYQQVLGLVTEVPLAQAAERLGKALRRPVSDLGTQLQGAHLYQIALRARGDKAWAFLSANEQPRGWWPEDRPRPPGRAGLSGTALAWPEQPGCRLVVVVDRDFGARVAAACTRIFGAAPVTIVA
jgi:hypothetical protein